MPRRSEYPRYRKIILRVVEWHWQEHGRAPSLREISDATGVSIGTAQKYVQYLSEEGLITWESRRHRSVALSKSGAAMLA